ncbi:MAG: glycosyltransferase, partial [Saprospiraceae bacterium]|nr:glycosyltransferase [Saprospiraceae bacterium]
LDHGHLTMDFGQSQSPIYPPKPWRRRVTNHQFTRHSLFIRHSFNGGGGEGGSPTTIIICARNEAENLRRFLPAILAQQFDGQWELLVVDDASDDATPEVLRGFLEKNSDCMRVLRMVEKTSPGKKHALTQGIEAAKFDQILLTDADCEPASAYWLAHMSAMLTARPETEMVLGYGPMSVGVKVHRSPCIVHNFSRYETASVAVQYFSFALAGMPYMGVGRNLAFKREVFTRAGGFSAHAHIPSGDDDLLVNAVANARNTAICLDPDSFVYSKAPDNWSAWLRQKQRHLAAGPYYQWQHKLVLGLLALSHTGFYMLFIVLIWAGIAPEIILGVFLLRLLSILFVFGKMLRVLREPDLFWRIPVYDALLAVYYGAIVPWLLIRKRSVEWRRG